MCEQCVFLPHTTSSAPNAAPQARLAARNAVSSFIFFSLIGYLKFPWPVEFVRNKQNPVQTRAASQAHRPGGYKCMSKKKKKQVNMGAQSSTQLCLTRVQNVKDGFQCGVCTARSPATTRAAQKKTRLPKNAERRAVICLAERAGFEPASGYYPEHAFQACDLNRSSTSPEAGDSSIEPRHPRNAPARAGKEKPRLRGAFGAGAAGG